MQTIQPHSKLILLGKQQKPRKGWPLLVLAAVLALITLWNISVIKKRYSDEERAEKPPSEQTETAFLIEDESGILPLHLISPAKVSASLLHEDPGEQEQFEKESGNRSINLEPVPIVIETADPVKDNHVSDDYLLSSKTHENCMHSPDAELLNADPYNGLSPIMVPGAGPGFGRAVENRVIAGNIRPGQVFSSAIIDAGLCGTQTRQIVNAIKDHVDFRRIRPGEGFRIKTCPEGELEIFDYEKSPVESVLVHKKNGNLTAKERVAEPQKELLRISGTINSNLFGAVAAAGAGSSLAQLLANVLAWDVDFYRDPRKGDSFSVVVERYHHRGRHLNYGRILAAEYNGAVGHVRLFDYERPDGKSGYYDEKGQSAQRAFLRAPLQVVRITSGYGNRRHPILGFTRAHRGVDYGAPTGTPVWAVGDGTVITAGRQGNYGNLVVIRHANSYTTWYAHLSRINVRVGERVRQQQVIGRVGATGMATGPHLHYEIRHRGVHINPQTLKLPPREPLPESMMEDYLEHIRLTRALLDGIELPPEDISADNADFDLELPASTESQIPAADDGHDSGITLIET